MRSEEHSNLWTKYASNPVLAELPHSIQFGQLAAKPGGGWYYFGAYAPSGGTASIYRWDSTDLITWSNKTEVIASGGVGAWDEHLQVALAFQKPDESWMMFYRGYNGSAYKIGRATSADGTTWTRHDNGGVDDGLFPQFGNNYDPTGIILVSGTYYLYLNGDGGHGVTNLYTSTDLDTWAAHASNPIFKNAFCGYVFKYGSYYYMAIPRDLGLTSSDLYAHGIALYRCATPVFTTGDREYLGYVIVNDQTYDDRYLDTPTFPFTDVSRDTYASEFGSTLWMLYTGDLTGARGSLASVTFSELTAREPIPETITEL